MNFFQKLFQSSETKSFGTQIINQLQEQFKYTLPQDKSSEEYLKQYKNWVFACINARGEEMANIDLILKNKNTGAVIEKHEILDLLNDVNPHSTKYEFFFATQAFKDLTGNAFWYLARDNDGKGKIRHIYLLPPDKMALVVDKENPLAIKGFVYRDNLMQVPFDVNEIIHFKNFNSSGKYPSPHLGSGIVQSALWAIETDNEARNWNYSFFKNSAKPDGILRTDNVLTEAGFKRVKEQWGEGHQGSKNNGKTAILEHGLSWQDISKTQKDMDFIAQRTFSRDEILALFRVPKSVVGITDDVNRANAEASDYIFARRTVKPLMRSFVTTLNEYLLSLFDSNLVFEFADPVPEDRVAKTNEYALGINKWLSRNDIRRAEGLSETESGDVFYGTFSEVAIDNAPKTKKVNESVAKQDKIEQKVNDFIAKLPKATKKEQIKLKDNQKAVYKEIYLKRFDEEEKKFIKAIKTYFDNQEMEVLSNVESEYAGLKSAEFKMKGLKDVLFDKPKALASGISLVTPFLREWLKQGASLADSTTDGDFDFNNPTSLNFIKERSKFFSESINDTTSEALLKRIQAELDAGNGLTDIKNTVRDIYKEASESRVNTISRTEVSASLNEGSKQAYIQAGITSWEWMTINPCPICVLNENQVVEIGKSFNSGEEQPPAHPNCMCSTVAVFDK